MKKLLTLLLVLGVTSTIAFTAEYNAAERVPVVGKVLLEKNQINIHQESSFSRRILIFPVKYSDFFEILTCLICLKTEFVNLKTPLFKAKCPQWPKVQALS